MGAWSRWRDWEEAISSVKSTFICNRMRETQFKILHRCHITPVIRNKMNNQISPLCNKCKRNIGTYIHNFWECPGISKFWSNIAHKLGKIFSGLFILGLPSKTLFLSKSNFKLCDKLLLLARRCILKQWISERPPSVKQWLHETYSVLPLERLTARVKGDDELFERSWSAFLRYLPPSLRDIIKKGRVTLDWNTLSIS